MNHKNHHAPIPTTYNGVTYRSRLEAKWQVFFDELEFEALYENSFVKNEKGEILYVPDFIVHSGIKLTDWTQWFYIEIKPFTPNQEYINFLLSLPIPMEVDLLVCVGPPSFYQPNGYWIMDTGGNKVVHKGFKLLQCRLCSEYTVMHLNCTEMGCHCAYPFGKEASARETAINFRFDL